MNLVETATGTIVITCLPVDLRRVLAFFSYVRVSDTGIPHIKLSQDLKSIECLHPRAFLDSHNPQFHELQQHSNYPRFLHPLEFDIVYRIVTNAKTGHFDRLSSTRVTRLFNPFSYHGIWTATPEHSVAIVKEKMMNNEHLKAVLGKDQSHWMDEVRLMWRQFVVNGGHRTSIVLILDTSLKEFYV